AEDPGVIAGAGRLPAVHQLLGADPVHEPSPFCPAAAAVRHPAANARHSATGRMSASSVTCAYSSSVVCTSAWPSRRDTTCTGTPASSKAVACECLIQCGVQPAG